MKIKTTIAVLTGLVLAVNVFGQGQVVFRNTPSTPVVDFTTGSAAATGVALAGLYYTTDLASTPDLDIPNDGWILAATTAITPVPTFAGVYSGGTVTITGLPEGTAVLLQVRAWSAAYADYEAAWAGASDQPTPLVGGSNVMQVSLGGGSLPVPNISTIVEGFTITPVPEPSTLVLGLLGGLGAMVLLRRRK